MNITQTIPALSLEGLAQSLRNGPAKFAFVKKDGTLRFALGTLKMDLIPTANHPKGTGTPCETVINFWDLEKSAWRRVSTSSLVFGN